MYTFTKKIRIIIHPIEILHKKNNFVLFGRFLAVDDTRIEPAGSVPVDLAHTALVGSVTVDYTQIALVGSVPVD